jgi:hypothetical protein
MLDEIQKESAEGVFSMFVPLFDEMCYIKTTYTHQPQLHKNRVWKADSVDSFGRYPTAPISSERVKRLHTQREGFVWTHREALRPPDSAQPRRPAERVVMSSQNRRRRMAKKTRFLI